MIHLLSVLGITIKEFSMRLSWNIFAANTFSLYLDAPSFYVALPLRSRAGLLYTRRVIIPCLVEDEGGISKYCFALCKVSRV